MRHAERKKPESKGELCRKCDVVGKGINLDRMDGMKNGGQGDSLDAVGCWIIPPGAK